MSFIDDAAFHVVEKDGTYTADDGVTSTFLAAGTRIPIEEAARYGLAKAPDTSAVNQDADTAENQERLHGARNKGAAPENREKR